MESKAELMRRVSWDCRGAQIGWSRSWPSCCFHSAPSNAESPLASETPIDGATRRQRARDMLAEFLFQRGPPWHELKSKPIVDHGEPAGRQRDPLPIDAGDVFAFGGRVMGEPRVGREFRRPRRPVRAGARC